MKILLCTIGMYEGTERLMPWRTIIEVAKHMNLQLDTHADIYSYQHAASEAYRFYDGVCICQANTDITELIKYVETEGYDAIYYPVAFRDVFKSWHLFRRLNIRKIAYIPGGIYSWRGVFALGLARGFSTVRSYLLEQLIPHRMVLSRLRKAGFSHLICQSDFTAKHIASQGWNSERVLVALPGIDGFGELQSDEGVLKAYRLQKTKFLLFSGAPAAIRGSILCMKAFDRFARTTPDARLVTVMRRDLHSDFSRFNRELDTLECKSQVTVLFEQLTPAQLKAFFERAYAVVLPFLLIPSEIPLTFFEVLSCGTPIVTFDNGGTTDYLKTCIVSEKSRSRESLASAMATFWEMPARREHLAVAAKKLITQHPLWAQTTKIWLQPIEKLGVLSSAASTDRGKRRSSTY